MENENKIYQAMTQCQLEMIISDEKYTIFLLSDLGYSVVKWSKEMRIKNEEWNLSYYEWELL